MPPRAKKKRADVFKLPDGTTTTNFPAYVRAWKRVGRSVGRVFGMQLLAFDPGIQLCSRNGLHAIHLSRYEAVRIAEVSDFAKRHGYVFKPHTPCTSIAKH
jgi:hypothetical protein